MTRDLVFDCSAVVDLLVSTGGTELVAELIGDRWHAPTLLDAEIVSALRGMSLGDVISVDGARAAVEDLARLPIERWQITTPLQLRALDHLHNLSAYDATYVALAEAIGATLVTRDQKLATTAAKYVSVELV